MGFTSTVKFLPKQQKTFIKRTAKPRQKLYSIKAAAEAPAMSRRLNVFYSYSHRDEKLRSQLDNHLSPLRRSRQIASWHDRQISPGTDIADEIDHHLATSDIVLLLISPDFLASDYCYSREMKCAIKRHLAGLTRVVPIILRPCDWCGTPFSRLLALPKDGKAVTIWQRRDEALFDIARGVRKAVEELLAETATPSPINVRGERNILVKRQKA